MAPDHPSSSEPRVRRRLSLEACSTGWAIKHGDGFLGVAVDRDEALRLLEELREVVDEGRASGAVTLSSQTA
jgi:hypothetical protein